MQTARASSRFVRLLQASDSPLVGRDLPRRSFVFDVVVTVVLVGLGLLLLRILARTADLDDRLFVVAVTLPLVLRRRMPRTALGLVVMAALAQIALDIPIGFHDSAVLLTLYSAVGCTNRRFGLTALALGLVVAAAGAVGGWWGYVDRQLAAPHWWVRPLTTLGAVVLVLATWALGERFRSARLGSIALAERAGQLERDREQQALLAAAAERSRIAREMHDVVAHGLSVMIVQADGAAYVVDTAPETARQALTQIGVTGRQALTEMRNLLGLLRTDGFTTETQSTPQPDLADLEALVEQARTAGAEVELHHDAPAAVPTMVSLTAYRIVQEALTNARKHGGPPVRVDVHLDRGGLRVRVVDHGAGPGGGTLTQQPGHGLIGLRERVAAVGGTVSTGPDDDGGFTVDAWLPLGESTTLGGGAR